MDRTVEIAVTADQLDLIVWSLLESSTKSASWTSPADKEKIKSLIKNLERQEFSLAYDPPPWLEHCHGVNSTT